MMSTCWFILLLTTVLTTVSTATSDIVSCPVNCSCESRPDTLTGCNYPNLYLHCSKTRRPQSLASDIDRLLTGNTSIDFSKLIVLEIVNTPLTTLPSSVCRLARLLELRLDHNNLTDLPPGGCFQNMTTLRTFSASHNLITAVWKGTFKGLKNLKRLDLNHNNISLIEHEALTAAAGLDSLEYISFNKNDLRSLDFWVIDRGLFGSLDNPVKIDLSQNLISRFTNVANRTVDCSRRSYTALDLSWNSISLISDLMHGWKIPESVFYFCLVLQNQGPPTFGVNMHGYSYDCSCRDYRYFRLDSFFKHANIFRGMYCETPADLESLEILRIPLERFVCKLTEFCPPTCRCIQQPSNITIHVICSGTNLTTLPERLPAIGGYFYRLVFSNCRQLRLLDSRKYFVSTKELDVSGSSVEGVTSDGVWNDLLQIQTVRLNGNKLSRLPAALVESIAISTQQLTLGGNPWICSCSDTWMTQWLKSLNSTLLDAGDILCNQPSRLYGRNVVSAEHDDFCVDPVMRAVVIAVTTIGSTFAAFVFVMATMYRYRVTLFTRWKLHPFDRDECPGGHFDDDVFISAAEDDHATLAVGLADTLESHGYRVCYGVRDFPYGSSIETGCVAITRSKRTLCLLTENYLQSPTCLFEFDFALHHNLIQLRKKRLIVLTTFDKPIAAIKQTELPANGNNNELGRNWKQFDVELLRQYLNQYPCISHNKPDWIDKLLYCLPIVGMSRQQQDEEDRQTSDLDDTPLLRP